jgi:hypothetical protein
VQYILTQAEYDELQAKATANKAVPIRTSTSKLQMLCTDAANHIPITRDWEPNAPASPWGCILNVDTKTNPRYCDNCPARQVCPYPRKEFSQ